MSLSTATSPSRQDPDAITSKLAVSPVTSPLGTDGAQPIAGPSQPQSGTSIIRQICSRIGRGGGIVPLIGSGMSAASRIPAGSAYQAYLFYCLTRVFDSPPWNPAKLRWPPYADVPYYVKLRSEMQRWSTDQQTQVGEVLRRSPEALLSEGDRARWQASGAVVDWRATLHFLSRVAEVHPNVILREPDPKIVDSFFVNLTEGKRPNAAHFLLAHLADVLRIAVILTTNFDNLIEAAFQNFDMPIATFDVHYEAGLPADRLVRVKRSVIKLHGGRYGIRADFSLDTPPAKNDAEIFASYLLPYGPDATGMSQSDLLVMGVSGEERRTMRLVCEAVKKFKTLNVYWLCYRHSEINQVQTAFRSTLAELLVDYKDTEPSRKQDLDGLCQQLKIESAPDLTLFLLQLFQSIFLCLPPAGVTFSAVWPAPAPPLARLQSEQCEAFEGEVKRLQQAILDSAPAFQSGAPRDQKKAILYSGKRGASSVLSAVFFSNGSLSRHLARRAGQLRARGLRSAGLRIAGARSRGSASNSVGPQDTRARRQQQPASASNAAVATSLRGLHQC